MEEKLKKEHKIITCASYGGSGSSIITDLLKEFSTCKSLGDFEFTFLHYPDGVSDLEDRVVRNKHRLSSGYAIYKFQKKVNKLDRYYSKFFGKNFINLSNKFIKKIIETEWIGNNELFSVRENIFTKGLKKILNYFFRLIKGKKEGTYYKYNKYPMYFSNISLESFYKIVQDYMSNLLCTVDLEDKYEYLVFDQLVPSSNIKKYLNYFKNIKVIVVDRDPRDLYILNKEFWHEGWIPEDVDIFIKWFNITREYDSLDKNNGKEILKIKFEDFIYNYDETLKRVIEFLNLKKENHIMPKKYFNNEISIKNTKLWLKHLKYKEDIQKIEKKLKGYCYGK